MIPSHTDHPLHCPFFRHVATRGELSSLSERVASSLTFRRGRASQVAWAFFRWVSEMIPRQSDIANHLRQQHNRLGVQSCCHFRPVARRRPYCSSSRWSHLCSDARRYRCCWSRQRSNPRPLRRRQPSCARYLVRPSLGSGDVHHRPTRLHRAHARC